MRMSTGSWCWSQRVPQWSRWNGTDLRLDNDLLDTLILLWPCRDLGLWRRKARPESETWEYSPNHCGGRDTRDQRQHSRWSCLFVSGSVREWQNLRHGLLDFLLVIANLTNRIFAVQQGTARHSVVTSQRGLEDQVQAKYGGAFH